MELSIDFLLKLRQNTPPDLIALPFTRRIQNHLVYDNSLLLFIVYCMCLLYVR